LINSESLENPLDTSKLAEATFSIIPAVAIHFALWKPIQGIWDLEVHFEQLYYILLGETDKELIKFEEFIEPYVGTFLMYILTATVCGGILGHLCKRVILFFYLDLSTQLFSISNEWDILVRGRKQEFGIRKGIVLDFVVYLKRCLQFQYSWKRFWSYSYILYLQYLEVPAHLFKVDILVRTSSEDVLYKGYVEQIFLSRGNTIDKIYLKSCKKKRFIPEQNAIPFSEIHSDVLVIKGEDIININVNYYYAEIEP